MATSEHPDHYFVVVAVYDETTGKYEFSLDDDTLIARFPEGIMWNGEEWLYGVEVERDLRDADWNLSVRLSELLEGDSK